MLLKTFYKNICGKMWGIVGNYVILRPNSIKKEIMIQFLGNIEAKTDAKGRVFIPSGFRKQMQLPADDCFRIGNSRHAFRMFCGQLPHTGAAAGIENQCFHHVSLLFVSDRVRSRKISLPFSLHRSPRYLTGAKPRI